MRGCVRWRSHLILNNLPQLMWYDVFSVFYDRALEGLYAPYRSTAVERLRLGRGSTVLDLPCGTGQSLPELVGAVGPEGTVLGIDQSWGMLRRAKRRLERAGWDHVTLARAEASEVSEDLLFDLLGDRRVDGVLCALGLTAIPQWERAFDRAFSVLRPGGRFVLFDVYAPERTLETRSVELVARADLSRKAWLPLAGRSDDFAREVLSDDVKTFGGELYVASGTRPER